MPRWSSHTKYCNIAIKNNFVGLKTWSRYRNSIVACPALDSQHKVVLQIKFFIFSFAIIVQYAMFYPYNTSCKCNLVIKKCVYISSFFGVPGGPCEGPFSADMTRIFPRIPVSFPGRYTTTAQHILWQFLRMEFPPNWNIRIGKIFADMQLELLQFV